VQVYGRHYSWKIYNYEAKVVPLHAMKEYMGGGGEEKPTPHPVFFEKIRRAWPR